LVNEDFPTQQQLDPKSGVGGPATQGLRSDVEKSFNPSRIAPDPARPSNINLQPFPPSLPPSYDSVMKHLTNLQIIIAGGCVVLWFFLAFKGGLWAFLWSSTLIGAFGLAAATAANLAQRKLEREVDRIRHDMHRQRGEKCSPPIPESVEWLNAFTKVIWGLIPPEVFVPITDSIEDVMQQSLPKFVEAVRISDIGQGINPFRVVSMRALPDQPHEKEYPREEWIDQGTNLLDEDREKAMADPKNKSKDLDQSGDYVVRIHFGHCPPTGLLILH
jgi:hypothetical protein